MASPHYSEVTGTETVTASLERLVPTSVSQPETIAVCLAIGAYTALCRYLPFDERRSGTDRVRSVRVDRRVIRGTAGERALRSHLYRRRAALMTTTLDQPETITAPTTPAAPTQTPASAPTQEG